MLAFSTEEVKALNNLVKNKKAQKGNKIVILSRSDYISKLNKNLENTFKLKMLNIEKGKALNRLIHLENRKNCTAPGHILDLHSVQLSNASSFGKNYAKLYFDAKHLEKGLKRRG